jgi:hypothetical protein
MTINKKLYHYTTIEAFHGIIQNSELWLSERNCMNDVFDEQYIKDIVKQELNPNNSPLFKGSYFDEMFISDKPQYIFSTTPDKDAAHQWLNYGKDNSICIAFDKDKLEGYFKEFSLPGYECGEPLYPDDFFSSPVIYDRNKVVNKMKKLVAKYRKQSELELKNITLSVSKQTETARTNFHKFYSCVKQENFKAENEYRFLIFSKRPAEYRIRCNSLISYIKIKIENKNLPITEIILNPYIHDDFNKNTVTCFLNKYKYDIVEVFHSKIHLRKSNG